MYPIVQDPGASDQTIYTWRGQDLIDKGQAPGTTSTEQAELPAARRQIRELETELDEAYLTVFGQHPDLPGASPRASRPALTDRAEDERAQPINLHHPA